MLQITPELLELAYGQPRRGVRFELWAPFLTEVALCYHLDTATRLGAFLAQVGHESGRLQFVVELWGPTAQQRRYEGTDLAARLGNTQPGDGPRYKGHGLIQVTGRTNHRSMTQRLRRRFPEARVPDFEANPQALMEHRWAALSAGEFWASRNLNALADAGDFLQLTKRVNGGTNGLADRQALFARALPACLLCGVDHA